MSERRVMSILAGVALATTALSAQSGMTADPWEPLRFLVGEWTGGGSGQPGAVAGVTAFRFGLGDHVMIRNNVADLPPAGGQTAGQRHEDLTVIHPQATRTRYQAIYFDNEGHVIQYTRFNNPRPGAVVFESEGGGQEPRYRLSYELDANGLLVNEFAVAPPGGEFKTYVKGTLVRRVRR